MTEARILTADELREPVVDSLTRMLAAMVANGAALGWTDPPARSEIEQLVRGLVEADPGDACGAIARDGDDAVGFGYWRRYAKPTQRQNADLDKLAVSPAAAGQGLGRALLRLLLREAETAGIEHLTLDLREGNEIPRRLYASEGFREYGWLPDFVAPGDGTRTGKIFLVRSFV